MEKYPVGIPVNPSDSEEEKDKMVEISERYFGETNDTTKPTLAKLKQILLSQNQKVNLSLP